MFEGRKSLIYNHLMTNVGPETLQISRTPRAVPLAPQIILGDLTQATFVATSSATTTMTSMSILDS